MTFSLFDNRGERYSKAPETITFDDLRALFDLYLLSKGLEQSVKIDSIQGFQFGNQKKKGDQCLATMVHRAFGKEIVFESR